MLAVVTAVNNANVGPDGSPQAILDGFTAAVVVSVIVAGLGVLATATSRRVRSDSPAMEPAGVLEPLPAEAD